MLSLLLWACAPPTTPDGTLRVPDDTAVTWPALGAEVAPWPLEVPEDFAVRRVFIDPGHASGENLGATTVWCETEADVMLDVAGDLSSYLVQTGLFEVRLARVDQAGPSYQRRVASAESWGADALLSLHLDARGFIARRRTRGSERCPGAFGEAGFSILYRDRLDGPLRQIGGGAGLLESRQVLARSLGLRLAEVGLLPYHGWTYEGLYENDPVAGVFLDRRRLYMTRAPSMPSVIVETFNGVDPEERWRWEEPETRAAFASAVAQALIDAL